MDNIGANNEVTDCDLAASHPLDPARVAPGVEANEVVTHVAISACRKALQDNPDVARLHYQLGRVLYYWAGANDADNTEAVTHVKHASDMEYTQAMFVYGLLLRYDGNVCASESMTKRAADNGLKSARITYVNLAVGGDFHDCEITASNEEMATYLEGAAGQVTGYYEQMLMESLRREFNQCLDAE